MTKKAPKAYFAKLGDFKQLPDNPNMGTERGQYMLETSADKFGAWRSATSTSDNVIPAGNHIAEIMAQKGMDDVIVVETDGKQLVIVKRQDVSSDDPRAREYAIADNRTSEVGLQWDAQILRASSEEELQAFFYDWELDNLLRHEDHSLDYDAEWQGMPEFEQNELFFHSLKVRFYDEESLKQFSELVKQHITKQVNAIDFRRNDD